MTMTDIKAALEKLQISQEASDKKIVALETALATATATNTELSAKLEAIGANVTSTLAAVTASTGETLAKLEGSIAAIDSKIKTSDAKAIEIAARAGVPAIEDHGSAQDSGSAFQQYQAILAKDPVKAAKFFAENKSKILAK